MHLLDTNHCSALLKGDPKIQAKLYNSSLDIVTCDIVMGELIYMVERSKRQEDNAKNVNALLSSMRVLSTNQNIAQLYGKLKSKIIDNYGPKDKKKKAIYAFKQIGISDNDLWIASIGIYNECTIVSQDTDFDRIQYVHTFCLESWL